MFLEVFCVGQCTPRAGDPPSLKSSSCCSYCWPWGWGSTAMSSPSSTSSCFSICSILIVSGGNKLCYTSVLESFIQCRLPNLTEVKDSSQQFFSLLASPSHLNPYYFEWESQANCSGNVSGQPPSFAPQTHPIPQREGTSRERRERTSDSHRFQPFSIFFWSRCLLMQDDPATAWRLDGNASRQEGFRSGAIACRGGCVTRNGAQVRPHASSFYS